MTEQQELSSNVPQSQSSAAQEAQPEVDSRRIEALATIQEPSGEIWNFEEMTRVGLPSLTSESPTAIRARQAHKRSMSVCVMVAFCGMYLSMHGVLNVTVFASSDVADKQFASVRTNRPHRFVETKPGPKTLPKQIHFGSIIPAASHSTDQLQKASARIEPRATISNDVAKLFRDCSFTLTKWNGPDFKAVMAFDDFMIDGTGKVEGGRFYFETERSPDLERALIGPFNQTTIDRAQQQSIGQSEDENEIDLDSSTNSLAG